jgi:hypothetical protein
MTLNITEWFLAESLFQSTAYHAVTWFNLHLYGELLEDINTLQTSIKSALFVQLLLQN